MKKAAPGVYKRNKLEERVRILANAVCGMRYDDAMQAAREMNAVIERGQSILEEFRDADRRGKWNSGRAGK